MVTNLINKASQPFVLDDYQVNVSVSVGISISSRDSNCNDMIQNADTAMYRAKKQGHNNFEFFKAKMNELAFHRLMIQSSLREVIKDQRVIMNYQPKVLTETKALLGAEALVRFSHPELAKISVFEIINLAEETALIVPLGEVIFREVCRQIKQWLSMGIMNDSMSIAVNLSSKQLSQTGLIEMIESAIAEYQVNPKMIKLELTESAVMSDRESDMKRLHQLKEMGFSLSVDDFGTGYSSFGRLKDLPVQEIKIDRLFVKELEFEPRDLAICRGIIKMAQELGLQVVAEGVENQEQFDLLKSCGCDQIQGYFISRPVDAEAMAKYLREWP